MIPEQTDLNPTNWEALAKKAYDVFGEYRNFESQTGHPRPAWESLSAGMRGAWVSGIKAAINGYQELPASIFGVALDDEFPAYLDQKPSGPTFHGHPADWDVAAKRGYDAYGHFRDWKTFDNRPMPLWDNLTPEIQEAWKTSAMHVATYLLSVLDNTHTTGDNPPDQRPENPYKSDEGR